MRYDTIVIGGGPAGLTAAIYLRRAGKSVAVIEKGSFGGQVNYSPKIENYPGFESISGNELADTMTGHAIAQGADVIPETVTGVRLEGALKTVVTEDGSEYSGACADNRDRCQTQIARCSRRVGIHRTRDIVLRRVRRSFL